MSKITISAILTLLRVIFTLGEKIVRLVYCIVDLVDDGMINDSAPRPEWMDVLPRVIQNFEDALHDLSTVSDSLTL